MNNIFFFIFSIYLQPLVAYELMKYQRGCDTWQATAKMVQPCIFLTKPQECTVNCAISSQKLFQSLYNKVQQTMCIFCGITICTQHDDIAFLIIFSHFHPSIDILCYHFSESNLWFCCLLCSFCHLKQWSFVYWHRLPKLPLQLGHEWVITSHINLWDVIIYTRLIWD